MKGHVTFEVAGDDREDLEHGALMAYRRFTGVEAPALPRSTVMEAVAQDTELVTDDGTPGPAWRATVTVYVDDAAGPTGGPA